MTFVQDPSLNTRLSSKSRTVLPKAAVTIPKCAKTNGGALKRGKAYAFSGTLSPKHAEGTLVRIYRWLGGKRQAGYLKATVGPAGKRYSISITFAKAGHWKLQAVYAASALNGTSKSRRLSLSVN
jgi:hypothetical protein